MVDSVMRDLKRAGDHEKPASVAVKMLIVAQKKQRSIGRALAHAAMGVGYCSLDDRRTRRRPAGTHSRCRRG